MNPVRLLKSFRVEVKACFSKELFIFNSLLLKESLTG